MAFRYRKFKVYQDALKLHSLIVRVNKNFPIEFRHLTNQMKRAALSIVLNIAEGSARFSDKDFNRFIGNSLGSVDEVVSCSEVALAEKLMNQEEFLKIEKLALEVSNQLGGLSKTLKG
ncbi:MAG: S23 ribosomal protein [Parcubacteria group bacterium Gr01-1014_72]|nr:MAG: S23 ribosomal protein [Parcubacteria group bacterium Gr01-1014_72]